MITSNFASGMQLKVEGGVVSEGGNPDDVQDEDRSLDTTRDLSGLGNHIVVEDEDELPSCIPNTTFNVAHSSEHTPEASCSSSHSVSMYPRHVSSPQNHNYEANTEFLQLSCMTPVCYINQHTW